MNDTLIDHLRHLQAGARWHPLLEALGQELEARLEGPALRALMAGAGQRFAAAHVLSEAVTLTDLARAMNQHWQPMGWGVVALEEKPGHLCIQHQFSPWPAAFGEAGMAWSAAFLEAVYQAWFTALGVDAALQVWQAGPADAAGSIEFRLGRQASPAVPPVAPGAAP